MTGPFSCEIIWLKRAYLTMVCDSILNPNLS